jgi:translocation and assembly module TamB
MIADTKQPGPPRRWGLRIGLAFCGLVVMIWAAPIVAAWTPLVSWLCAKAANDLDGSVHVGSASLGWFSPVVLYNVEIRAADDQPIARIPKVEGDRSLLILLVDQRDLGTFRFERPTIEWTFAKGDSNLEKVLAKSLQGAADRDPGEKPTRIDLPQMRLDVVDAMLKIHDADTNQNWQMQSVFVSAVVNNDAAKTVLLNVEGSLHDGTEAGILKAEVQLQNALEPNAKATIKGRFTSFPLALANVLVRRYFPDTQLGGSLQGHCQISAEAKGGNRYAEVTGQLTGIHVRLTTPALADTLHVESLRAPCTLRLEDQKLIAQKVELHSDFGKVSVQGAVDFGADWRAAFAQPDFDLALEVNLATVAERLPKTLRVHKDLRLTAGQLNAQCKSHVKNGEFVWQGNLHMSDVRGIKGKQTIAWAEPITLEFQVRDPHRGIPLIDHLKCSARFLQVEGSQTADQFTLTAEADLRKLAEPLGQFIDLEAIKLAGQASGTIKVRRMETDKFHVQGGAELHQMNLTWFAKQPWQEESVSAKFEARCQIGKTSGQRIETANVEVGLGDDRALVKLTEPIHDVAAGPWGSLSVRVAGDLSRWQNRVRTWTTALDAWQLAGQADVQMQVRPAPHAIECTSAIIQANNFRCTGSSMWIQEPTFKVQTAARWDIKTRAIDLTQTKLTCPAIQVDAAKLSVQPGTKVLRGALNITGDLARLRKWTQDPHAKPGEPMAGTFEGRLDLQTSQDRLSADIKMSLKDFSYGNAADPTWREADVKCVGRGVYDLAKDALHLEKIDIAGAMLSAAAKGAIANFTTSRDIDLAGTLTYELEKMAPQLRPLLGKDVKIAGKDARAFKVAGPLYPKSKTSVVAVSIAGPPPPMRFSELKGEASLNWKSLKAHGCDVGPAEVKAILQQGWLQLYPIETTLNGGKLRLQPNLRLDPEPMEMVLLAGPVIEKAKITPAMCAGPLGYALPALANVAEAEGLISLTLEGGRVPLSAPSAGEIKGTIVLHHAKLGPNPLVRELAGLLKIPAATGQVMECQVPFHMVNGKVHHSNLELAFADFTLKSSGAVGLDGSLAIVVDMPIPPPLATAAKLTPAQAKQTLRIPIGGTLEHPRPDPRALESLTAVLGRSLLENQLNRLLQPKR